jgi:hypothetical protein
LRQRGPESTMAMRNGPWPALFRTCAERSGIFGSRTA